MDAEDECDEVHRRSCFLQAKKGNDLNTVNTNARRISFLQILTLIFVAAKLMGYIAWSWIWVLSPLWIPMAIGLTLMVIVLIILGVVSLATGTPVSRVSFNKRW